MKPEATTKLDLNYQPLAVHLAASASEAPRWVGTTGVLFEDVQRPEKGRFFSGFSRSALVVTERWRTSRYVRVAGVGPAVRGSLTDFQAQRQSGSEKPRNGWTP
jgi:hypothetical protein